MQRLAHPGARAPVDSTTCINRKYHHHNSSPPQTPQAYLYPSWLPEHTHGPPHLQSLQAAAAHAQPTRVAGRNALRRQHELHGNFLDNPRMIGNNPVSSRKKDATPQGGARAPRRAPSRTFRRAHRSGPEAQALDVAQLAGAVEEVLGVLACAAHAPWHAPQQLQEQRQVVLVPVAISGTVYKMTWSLTLVAALQWQQPQTMCAQAHQGCIMRGHARDMQPGASVLH